MPLGQKGKRREALPHLLKTIASLTGDEVTFPWDVWLLWIVAPAAAAVAHGIAWDAK